jgi:hypothetical protein
MGCAQPSVALTSGWAIAANLMKKLEKDMGLWYTSCTSE